MKPIGDNGHELDAIFSVEPTSGGAHLILESRGGSRGGGSARNTDYAGALNLLLTPLRPRESHPYGR
jgi:hypothetical protein